MAITKHETKVQWSASDTGTCTANSTVTSDAFTPDDTCIAMAVILEADGPASPASDDYINFYLLPGGGSVGSGSVDVWSTAETEHSDFLRKLDTSIAVDTTNDIVRAFAELPIALKNFKIQARGDHADTTTNSITVAATVIEIRAA